MVTNASGTPPRVVSKPPLVGKSVDWVCPVTSALPLASIAMPEPYSVEL